MADLLVPVIISDNNVIFHRLEAIRSTSGFSLYDDNGDECYPDLLFDKIKHIYETLPAVELRFDYFEKNETCIQIDESTQSISLGVIVEIYRELNNRNYLSYWDSIIVTGDVNKNLTYEVSDIDFKYKAAEQYSEQNKNKKILFVYVGSLKNSENGTGWVNHNLYKLQILSGTPLDYIYPEFFQSAFNSYQDSLFNKINERTGIEIKTQDLFQNIKSTVITNKELHGVYLSGPKSSLKNIYAKSLCEYLVSINERSVPVWIDCSRFTNSIEWLDGEFRKFLNCDKEIDKTNNYVFVFANTPCEKTEQIISLVQFLLKRYNIEGFYIFTSLFEEKDKLLLDKNGITQFALNRDFSLFFRKNIPFCVLILIISIFGFGYWNKNIKKTHKYYKDVIITADGILGIDLVSAKQKSIFVYDFTYRKNKIISISYINRFDNSMEMNQLLNLISYSSVHFDYLQNGKLSGIKFFDNNKNFICSYNIEKQDNSFRLNLNKVNAQSFVDYFAPAGIKAKFVEKPDTYNLVKINSIEFLFNDNFLSAVIFYKYHDSFELAETTDSRCGYYFKTDSYGRVIEQTCLVKNESLSMPVEKESITDVCKIIYEYNDHSVKISNVNSNGDLVMGKNYSYYIKTLDDENDSKTYFKESGEILISYADSINNSIRDLHVNDYKLFNFVYNSKKHLVRFTISYADSTNLFVEYKYDKNNRIISQSFINDSGELTNSPYGYAYTVFEYDVNKICQRYYDSDGKNCDNSSNISELLISYDEDIIISQKIKSVSEQLLEKSNE